MPSRAGSQLYHFSTRNGDNDSIDVLDDADSDENQVRQSSSKSSGACVDCKSVKVRCEAVPGERKCRRCLAKNLPCRPRERKKRKPADTHEQLQEKAHERDIQIQRLLHQYDQLKEEQKRREWMSRASSSEQMSASGSSTRDISRNFKWQHKGKSAEAAVVSCFSIGHGSHQLTPPEVIKYCGLYPEDIIELFKIFFERINPYFSILDEELHTPHNLIWTSPFLFTVICAVASRYYTIRPDIYPLAIEFARDAAGKALIDERRGVDVCQAYLLMAVYPVPKKKWTEDRSWLLMGVAIRMAMELELNQPPPAGCDEREGLNRTRTWLNCYCVDGSHAIQFGKQPMLRLDDYVARKSRNWYKLSPMNTAFDVHLCAYVQIIILMAEWRHAMNVGLNSSSGFDAVASTLQTQEKLSQEWELWVDAYAEEYSFAPLPICQYRGNTTQMITAYLRLVVLAVGFQHSMKRGLSRDSEVVVKSIDAARTVIQIMLERLYPTGYLRYAMEANFLYVSFAAAFLINLLRPKFLPLLDESRQREIILLVTRLIKALGSNEVALDGRHTPALYSRFLSSLLGKHHAKEMHIGTSPIDDSSLTTAYSADRLSTPPNVFHWPDVGQAAGTFHHLDALSEGMIYQQQGDTDMDFSLTHFVRTVSQDLPPQPYCGQMVDTDNWRDWGARNDHSSGWSQPSQFLDFWRP
ncbi:fungal-specific transcription factor domain-containing protein [Crucibulum laeve]|uniref:Fungal-specific transcription factor domain-containing protein n=1 Tax=Crucibulum laeve TaxID=68775 RepID=A0A5C3MCL0_9AGAR|nr:fungal-specific transcription factor domain-containing protein [Crucibulum laeve]